MPERVTDTTNGTPAMSRQKFSELVRQYGTEMGMFAALGTATFGASRAESFGDKADAAYVEIMREFDRLARRSPDARPDPLGEE